MSEEQKGDADGDKEEGEEGEEEEAKEDETAFTMLGDARPTSKMQFSMYTPPEPKTDEKFSKEDKTAHELVRRWRVVIQDIEITNLTPGILSPFVKFIIGGDYFIDIKKLKSKSVYLPKGDKGISQMTEQIPYLDGNSKQAFQTRIEVTFTASYFELMEQHLHIELWNSSRFFLNTYIGYESLNLLGIAGGSIAQQVIICDKIERDGEFKSQKVQLNFKLYFEEVWDYMIKFIDWRTSNLENRFEEKASQVNPKLEFNLVSKNVISNKADSITLKNQKLPYWEEVGKGIIYRGTYSQLQEEFLEIKLFNKGLTAKPLGVPRSVSLTGVLNSQLETQLQIHRDKANREELFQSASVKGLVKLASMPKFQQSGTFTNIKKNMRYLVVYVTKVNIMEAISGLGEPQFWVEVEWGGIRQKSTMTKARPTLNQYFYFQLSLTEEFLKKAQRPELVDAILQELRTKPEILLTVWADPANGQKAIISLGACTIPLSDIANAAFQDRDFTDPKTRQKINFQSRVLFKKAMLESAYQRMTGLNVELSMWFQQELPFPDIDLASIKGSSADVFPREIASKVKPPNASFIDGEFFQEYNKRLQSNFACLTDQKQKDARIEGCQQIKLFDFAKKEHLLTQYMTKIAPQDQNLLLPEERDDEFLHQLEQMDWFKKNSQLARGIRTLKEVAHFVRSIPITPDIVDPKTWSTPDVMLTMRQGQVHDHALLLAAMFRAVKYETMEELMAEFVKAQLKRNANSGKDIIKKLSKAGVSGGDTTDAGPINESAEKEEESGSGSDDDDDGESKEDPDTDSSDSDKGDVDDSNVNEDDIDVMLDDDAAAVDSVGNEPSQENESIEERVFVCMGKYKNSDEKAVWVLTYAQDFQTVTIWNCVQHKDLVLQNRVDSKEVENLKAYLTPFAVQKENLKTQSKAERTADDKYRGRVDKWREEYKRDVEGIESDDGENQDDLGDGSDMGDDEGMDKKGDDDSEEEFKADEDFIDQTEVIIRHNDLDEVLKGYRIEQVGQVNAQGIKIQDDLKDRVNIDDTVEDVEEENLAPGAEPKKLDFFALQRAEMKRQENLRDDKHILPKTFAVQGAKKGEKQSCEYGEIYLMFNHKNIWANLQNADPLKISYELHNDSFWLPYVRDSIYPHRWDNEDELLNFKRWQQYVHKDNAEMQDMYPNMDDKSDPNRFKIKLQKIDFQVKGEYLQPFQPFFGPKERLDPLSNDEIIMKEKMFNDEIEKAIKQMRSIAHIKQTNMNFTKPIQRYIEEYLAYMEDYHCGRFNEEESEIKKEKLRDDLCKLIPTGFDANIFPMCVNFVDQEKVIALFKDKANSFCTAYKNQQQFSIGIKIFPFDNRVVSFNVLILRMEKANFHDGETDSEDELNMLMATEAPEEEAQATKGSSKKDKGVNLFSKKGGKNQDNPQSGRGANNPERNIQLKKK